MPSQNGTSHPSKHAARCLFLFVAVLGHCGNLVATDADGSRTAAQITVETVAAAERMSGVEFSTSQREQLLNRVRQNRRQFESLRTATPGNHIPPALVFNPLPAGFAVATEVRAPVWSPPARTSLPESQDALAYYSVGELSEFIRTRKISAVQLTEFFLNRLKKFGAQLECVVTLTEERAMKHARRADAELAEGTWRGPLHGIPYGAKDLLAVAGYPPTWGAKPYANQIIDRDAAVIRKLDDAGAILVAKLTLGALAWGDVWFGGKTRNPWDLEQGSSGSSAGPASATAAGLVPFAIGSETWGSIVSPATRCGVTGLRPTFGRVSRDGAMALSWSMDKIGPLCRTVEDCAIVLSAVCGSDPADPAAVDAPFNYRADLDLRTLRVGYLKAMFDRPYPGRNADLAALEVIRGLGVDLAPVELPDYPVQSISFILNAEAAAAFDSLTRSGLDDSLVRQVEQAWPNVFRASRFIPAVEYIQANRVRYQIIQSMHSIMAGLDVYVAPTFSGDNLLLTNLTGHPCVVVPNGFNKTNHPLSITFTGSLFGEAALLALARRYQEATDFHKRHPTGFRSGSNTALN